MNKSRQNSTELYLYTSFTMIVWRPDRERGRQDSRNAGQQVTNHPGVFSQFCTPVMFCVLCFAICTPSLFPPIASGVQILKQTRHRTFHTRISSTGVLYSGTGQQSNGIGFNTENGKKISNSKAPAQFLSISGVETCPVSVYLLSMYLPHICPFWVKPPAALKNVPQYLLTRAVAVGLQTLEDAAKKTAGNSFCTYVIKPPYLQ